MAAKTRRKGLVTVMPRVDNRPRLKMMMMMMMMKDSVTHKPICRYDWQMQESFRVKVSRFHWDKALWTEIGKLSR